MSNDITDAIEMNPGGTDLEIALAIGVSEEQVREKRSIIASKVAKAREEKEKAKTAAVKASPPAAEKPKESTTKPTEAAGERPHRTYVQDANGASRELVLFFESKSTTIYNYKD